MQHAYAEVQSALVNVGSNWKSSGELNVNESVWKNHAALNIDNGLQSISQYYLIPHHAF